jgi:hypothetical protein
MGGWLASDSIKDGRVQLLKGRREALLPDACALRHDFKPREALNAR